MAHQVFKKKKLIKILKKKKKQVIYVILYIVCLTQLIVIFSFIILLFKTTSKSKKTSTFTTYCIKILSFYAIILVTIGIIPFFNILIIILYCDPNSKIHQELNCYSGTFFIHFSIAIFFTLILSFFSLLFRRLYIDLNPCSKLPFASPQSKYTIIKFGLKILLPIYTTFDSQSVFEKVFVILLMIFNLLVLVQGYFQCPNYYDRNVEFIQSILDCTVFWISCCSFICILTDKEYIGILYMLIGIPFISFVYCTLLFRRNVFYITKQIKGLKKEEQIESYINVLIYLIENRDKPLHRIQLEGVLKYHVRQCTKSADQCGCQELAFTEKEEEDENQLNQNNQQMNNQNANIAFIISSRKWYLFAFSILQDCLERFQKSPKLHLLHSYIQQGKLQNKFKSLFELMITQECKPNIQQEFSIYRQKILIEDEMIESDLRGQENKSIEVNNIVIFQNNFVIFQAAIENSVTFHLEFWSKLLEESPDIQKLLYLGSKITKTLENTEQQFKKLQQMNPNHIKCLEIYGNFLKLIVNDDSEGLKIIEKAEYIQKTNQANKQFLDPEKLKYGENSNTCIIQVSGNLNSIGIITNSNNEVTRILGFQKNELIEQNVSRIMPKVYGDLHDKFISKYLNTSQSTIIGQERLVMCLNKQGYIVPCTLMIKVLPNLTQGIQMVGFIKEQDDYQIKSQLERDEIVHYLIYRQDSYQVQAISQSCFYSFGIPAQLVYGNSSNISEFTIDQIAPGIVDEKNIEDMRSIQGSIIELNSIFIQQNFLVDDQEEEEEIDEVIQYEEDQNQEENVKTDEGDNATPSPPAGPQKNNNKKDVSIEQRSLNQSKKFSKYRKVNVKVNLILEADYGDGYVLNTIKFTEIDETINDDNPYKIKSNLDDKSIAETDIGTKGGNQQNHKNNKEDEGSNVSAGSLNEDIKQLKDFKALISEKTVPKSITILKRTVFLLLIIICSLTGYSLARKLQEEQDILESNDAMLFAYTRPYLMSDINFYSKKLWLLGNGYLTPQNSQTLTDMENIYKNRLELRYQTLQQTQFNIIKSSIKMKNRMKDPPSDTKYDCFFRQQDNSTSSEKKTFTDAIFQYVTSASSLKSSYQQNFKEPIVDPKVNTLIIEPTLRYYFFVRQNGLFQFRQIAESTADDFYKFYYDLVSDFEVTFRIIMIIGIIFLILSQFILIPIVFQVTKTNNRVLSLFGYIPMVEIKDLAQKCEKFIQDYLSQENQYQYQENNQKINNSNSKNKNNSNFIEINNEINSQINKLNNNDPFQSQQNLQNADNSQLKMPPGNPNFKSLNNSSPFQKRLDEVTQKDKKSDKKEDLEKKKKIQKQNEEKAAAAAAAAAAKLLEDQDDFEYSRSAKLLNQKDGNKKIVIFQFSFIAFLFIIFFIVHYVLEIQFISDVNQVQQHLKYSFLRPSYLKYNLLFTLEEITEGSIQKYNDADLRETYTNNIYENEKQVYNSYKEGLPSAYSSYTSKFDILDTQQICTNVQQITDITDCQSIFNGILSKGLRTSIVSFAETLRDISSKFNKLSGKTQKQKIDSINGQDFVVLEKGMDYIIPAMDQLNTLLITNIEQFLQQRSKFETIFFSVFITIVLAIFFFAWIPYLSSLSIKIWRTKGMLNMIPMEVITKYDTLKKAFVSGDILKAVK